MGSGEIRFPKGDEGAYRADRVRKSHTPKRDFERVLKRKEDKHHDDEKEQQKVKEEYAETKKKGKIAPPLHKLTDGEGETSSLFDLSRESATKPEAEASPKTGNVQEMTPLNPMAMQQHQLEVHAAETVKGPQGPSPIQEIVEKIVEKLSIIETKGQSDTMITIKNHPLFAGTKVVITEFDIAKGEFNISFQNLTQAGKNLLDLNQDSFKMGLEQKGFVVHIVTITTLDETKEIAENSPTQREHPDDESHDDDSDEQSD